MRTRSWAHAGTTGRRGRRHGLWAGNSWFRLRAHVPQLPVRLAERLQHGPRGLPAQLREAQGDRVVDRRHLPGARRTDARRLSGGGRRRGPARLAISLWTLDLTVREALSVSGRSPLRRCHMAIGNDTHTCPFCDLVFSYHEEVKDHVVHDHPTHAA